MPHRPLPLNRIYLSHTISEPAFGATPETLFYVKVADGKRAIYRQSTRTGLAQVVTTEPMPKGGVGYGGGIFAVRGDRLVYAAKGGTLQGLDLATGDQRALTPAYEGVAAPAISPCGQFVAFLCEQGGRCNVLLTDIDGRSLPVKVSADPWYAFNPSFSPDGSRLVWIEWDEFDMPWDQSRLKIARFARATAECAAPADLLPLAGVAEISKPRVGHGAPQFSPNSRYLAYTSDEFGWRSLWVANADGGDPVPVDTGDGEIGGPDWVPGLISVRWSGDSTAIYALRRHQNRDTLLRVAWPLGRTGVIDTQWAVMTDLNTGGGQLVFVGTSPTRPATLVTLDPANRTETPRATNAVGLLDAGALVTPEVLSWETAGGETAWGILYRAAGPEAGQGPRPLIVMVHGGPTSERPLIWLPEAQYYATRGWHYLVVNHRGGTGFGRAFQDKLNGQWGVVDVEDSRSGAEHLVNQGLADPQRLVITGGSAGGYTTLMALTHDPDFWAAGVGLYAVANMYDLRLGAHRFEVNYEFNLIGRLPEAGPLWKERSPITHVKNVRAPLLLFHGTEDEAVPHQQSVEFVEAVKRQGGLAELVSYEGEGHGFVKEATRRDVIERTEKFLDKYVLCLQK